MRALVSIILGSASFAAITLSANAGYVGNDPLNNTDPTGLCSTASGELVDCPDVTANDDGRFTMNGADFNGFEVSAVNTDSLATMNEVVNALDQGTATPAG